MKVKQLLAERIRSKKRAIWEWESEQARLNPPPFYCSIDLRDAGFKIAPVDNNLYPAGFNNVCPEDLRMAGPRFREQVDRTLALLGKSSARKILVLPESHTANRYYWENLHYLSQIIQDAGIEMRVGWLDPAAPAGAPLRMESQTQKIIEAWPVRIENGLISVHDFVPDAVLLNNDFSSGYPPELDRVEQPILPTHQMGWHSRKKSEHFRHYNALAAEFANILDVDPWIIQIDSVEVGPVNFNEGVGIEAVAQAAQQILQRSQEACEDHQVKRKPFVFVKNNSGTYGMGIMVVHSAEEILSMNRRTKNKMSVGKNHSTIESVVVQEGVPTATLVDRLAAEPVIYLFGSELVGGFLRTNSERGDEENLNSQGMVFRKLCMSDLRRPQESEAADAEPDDEAREPELELVYGSIARISALAAGREISEAKKA